MEFDSDLSDHERLSSNQRYPICALIGTQLDASPPPNAIDSAMLFCFAFNHEVPIFIHDAYTQILKAKPTKRPKE
jgi:hypothetical protein